MERLGFTYPGVPFPAAMWFPFHQLSEFIADLRVKQGRIRNLCMYTSASTDPLFYVGMHATGQSGKHVLMYALESRATTPPPPYGISPPTPLWPPRTEVPLLLRFRGAAVPLPLYGTQPLLHAQSGICTAAASRIRHELRLIMRGCMAMVMVAAVL